MIFSDEEINNGPATLGNLWDIKTSHLKANARIRELEANLRELAEAAEWRDECNALYSEMYQDWLCDDKPLESLEWMESIFDISKAAEDAYQVALKVAKDV